MKSIKINQKITNCENHSFKQYLNEVSNIKTFTPEEEAECAYRILTGDKSAVEEMIKRNLRFVISIAKQYETPSIPIEDLINEGNIGLILAVEKYKPNTGFKFITYAVFWIRKMIFEFIDKHSRIVRLPSNKITDISKHNQKINELEQKYGRNVFFADMIDEINQKMTDKEIADAENEIKEIEKISTIQFNSLDTLIGDGDGKTSLYEMISDDNLKPTDHLVSTADLTKNIKNLLNVLKPRDRKIMILLYGLDGLTPLNIKEVAEHIGLTREMIRQINEKSLKLLKKAYVH
jgi:RNA polymerase primary sigma factor